MPRPLSTAPEVEIRSRADLRGWLAAHHDTASGVWLVIHKKSEGAAHVPVPDIVQECLCFGWVDSLVRKKDDRRSMLYIARRKPGSGWSKVNKDHVAAVTAAGLITDAGRAVIDRARADGSWDALNAVEALIVPDDLAQALEAAGLRAIWDVWPRSVRRGALEILLNAKQVRTRAARIATIVDCAQRGVRPFQWQGVKAPEPE